MCCNQDQQLGTSERPGFGRCSANFQSGSAKVLELACCLLFLPHSLLKLALGLYQKTLCAAAQADDFASAHKNIAATLAHLAQCVDGSSVASSSNGSSHAQCVLGEAVELLQQAVQHR